MQDPRYVYSQPPFTPQPQPFPGSSAAMSPEPDHGEDSYRGSGRLAGRRALITGGDSGIGRAVAIAYAREDADIALSYLPEEQADAEVTAEWVRQAGRRVLLLPGDIERVVLCDARLRREQLPHRHPARRQRWKVNAVAEGARNLTRREEGGSPNSQVDEYSVVGFFAT